MSPELKDKLVGLLREYADVFAWALEDLQGVDRSIIEHKLSIDPRQKPRKQKVRKMSTESQIAARVEVQKLLRVIREVAYLEWLANVVVVRA